MSFDKYFTHDNKEISELDVLRTEQIAMMRKIGEIEFLINEASLVLEPEENQSTQKKLQAQLPLLQAQLALQKLEVIKVKTALQKKETSKVDAQIIPAKKKVADLQKKFTNIK